jgi:hypothetical protein
MNHKVECLSLTIPFLIINLNLNVGKITIVLNIVNRSNAHRFGHLLVQYTLERMLLKKKMSSAKLTGKAST